MPSDQSSRRGASGEGASVSFRTPDLLRATLLLLLHERGDYGYELRNRLTELFGLSWDHGTVYRVLNQMDDEGLVTSGWEHSESGPARRRYRLTEVGVQRLDAWSRELDRLCRILGAFESRYRHPGATSKRYVEITGRSGSADTRIGAVDGGADQLMDR